MISFQVAIALVAAAVFFALKYFNATDTPKIKGIPEIPGVPIFGNLLQLGTSHATVTQKWAAKYGPVFQTRLGNRRVVFVNSYETVKHFWITNQAALISRPMFHTFHSVVSSSQGFTIGTSPWDESCKQRRKAAGTALNRPAVQSYMPILDLESTVSIKELLEDSKNGTVDIDPIFYFARFALNTSLTLNYGYRIDGTIDSELLKEITYVEREISNFRSTSNNWQDYIPLLRVLPKQSTSAEEFRLRRDRYLSNLLQGLKDRIAAGTDKPCITGNILKDPEAKLNEGMCTSSYRHNNIKVKCTDHQSRDQVHLSDHGVGRPRYRTWQHRHGLGLPFHKTRPSNPSQVPRGNRGCVPQRRVVGKVSR